MITVNHNYTIHGLLVISDGQLIVILVKVRSATTIMLIALIILIENLSSALAWFFTSLYS